MAPRQEFISLGPTPLEENCQQVGAPTYDWDKAVKECWRFVQVIRQVVGPEPDGARLIVMECPHDFGTYHDVVCCYDEDNPEAFKYALACEDKAPTKWPDSPCSKPE